MSQDPIFPPFDGVTEGVRHPGKVIWRELFTADPESSKAFYSGLFGWEIEPINETLPNNNLLVSNGYQVGGLIHRARADGDRANALWVNFISTDDIDRSVADTKKHGGKVIFDPGEFPDRGRAAVIGDCCGNAIAGLVESSNGDPGDFRVAVGEWYWTELVSPDVKGAATFCKEVFGYEIDDDERTDRGDDYFLSVDGEVRAGLAPLPDSTDGDRGYWIGFVRVSEMEQTVQRAQSLGAKVELKPVLFAGGSLAVLSDPEGAIFGVIEVMETYAGGTK